MHMLVHTNSKRHGYCTKLWALAFAGVSLVQNYGTNLFDAIDPKSKYNGHVLAASQAAGSLGSYCAVCVERFATQSGLYIYVLGLALIGILCACMSISSEVWAAYILYVAICGIYQTLSCLLSVRCGRLLSNHQFILLFSINNFAGLLIETLLQAAVEFSGFTIFQQFICFAGFFLLSTAAFIGVIFISCGGSDSTSRWMLDGETDREISFGKSDAEQLPLFIPNNP